MLSGVHLRRPYSLLSCAPHALSPMADHAETSHSLRKVFMWLIMLS